ncbi:MAG TPA: GGDEF domain-containing protein [Burkholderiaceae bacterium]|nr:GGDEF domain-containing protein [Burkholderiaceae bacterium]
MADIALARELLDTGDAAGATQKGQSVLERAARQGNDAIEAQAHLLLAHVGRLLTRFREARDHSEHAIVLFQKHRDLANEAHALSMLAYCASCLGRNDEAIEAAMLGVRLAERQPPGPQLALALNDLGVASLWARSFDSAEAAFLQSIDLGERLGSPASLLSPSINLAWCEALRLVVERYHTGRPPEASRHSRHVDRLRQLVEKSPLPRGTGMQVTVQTLWLLSAGANAAWRGLWAEAASYLSTAETWLCRYKNKTWLDALHLCASTELAWAQGDLPKALSSAIEMIRISDETGHEQIAQLGLLVAAQLHELQGDLAASLAAVRQLQRREQSIRIESLASRARAVQWHLTAREREQEVFDWTRRAHHLEQLSLKDPLTDIANRRGFDIAATAALTGKEPVCIALVDVDRFKQVNDGHSHQVGDQVLMRIAAILSSQVREQDMAARLAGDEFVVLFRSAPLAQATRACLRIQDEVRKQDWDELSPGLDVSISVGVVQSEAGETLASVLHRSDAAMYARKNGTNR